MNDNELRDRIAAQVTPHLYYNYSKWEDANETDRDDAREVAQAIIDDLGLTVEHGAAFDDGVIIEPNTNLETGEADRMVTWNPGMKHMVRVVGKWEQA